MLGVRQATAGTKCITAASERRVHLVLDTVITERLWDLIDAAKTGSADERMLAPGKADPRTLRFEQVNAPSVMSPWEIRGHLAFVSESVQPHSQLDPVMKRLDRFADGWAALWAQYGTSRQGIAEYRRLLDGTRAEMEGLGAGRIRLSNELQLSTVLDQLIFVVAVAQQPFAEDTQRLAS